jgi:ChrR-like protein with cupin domain
MNKPELEFHSVEDVEWTPVDERVPGLTERILARDDGAGVATRMLRFAPGTDTSLLGTMEHKFWEEVYILSGEFHDLGLDDAFTAGMYACRPPGMRHGPWRSTEGCVTFEVRYPAGD